MNNDNKLDVVVANARSTNLGILLNKSDRSLYSLVPYSIVDTPLYVIATDLNNDHKIDIVATKSGFKQYRYFSQQRKFYLSSSN